MPESPLCAGEYSSLQMSVFRVKYNRPETETEPMRKLEIIRTLYMNGLTSYIPEEDKVPYRQLVDARERHDKLKRLYEDRKLR